MSNKTVNTLACLFGLAAMAASVEANRTDADATAIRADAGWARPMEGMERPACDRVRWRGGAEPADAYAADGQPGCFAHILRELAGDMGRTDAPTVPARTRSAAAATGVAPSSTASNDDADIPDAGLREALAEALGKEPDEAITTDEMAELTGLAATDRGIVDLTGLRHATNLRELELDRNAIVDISEIRELSALARLSLGGNAIADLSPLAGLKGLRSLSLARNGLTDVEDLATMDGLETLDLAGNELADLWPLNLLTGLRDLALDDNRISNLGPLFDLQALETLTLAGNEIESVEALAALAGLRTLSLADNRIADVWFLSGLESVERLSLRGNELTDVSPLAGLTELAQLWLGSNQLTDISPLSGLGGLVLLDLERNRIADVAPLAVLTSLVGLGLGDNGIADAGALSALAELTALDLGGNNLADAPALAGLQNLETLWLHANGMDDIAPLAGLDALARLELGDNDIVDVGPLAGLTDLTTLGLAGNAIEDVGALAGLDKLVRLSLSDNNLSDLGPLSALAELAALWVSFNEVADIAPLAGLKTLQRLALHDNRISDLSSLAGLADLKVLGLGANVVADVSALEGLVELRQLILAENNIRDVSPLAGLTKLRTLTLGDNMVADIGPLAGLRDMRVLDLEYNGISELGDVGRLKNLSVLDLENNDVVDIGSLVDNPGMGPGDLVDVRQNPLDARALGHVEDLRARGVRVLADEPDLVAESASVSDASPDAGGSFTLSATVRNAGAGASAATTLRYYRSDDAAIDAADTEVGTDAVPALAAGAESAESISLTAPSSAGTYYYGACVDSVSVETDTANNCSEGVEVEVADSGGGTGDDHGDAFASATSVAVPSTTDGELEEGGDKDYFRFEVAASGTLTVETAGDTDTYGTLFDSDETSLETDDDDGAGRNFMIEREVTAGTYYVEVRGFSSRITGTYELAVQVSSSGGTTYEEDDTITTLPTGSWTPDRLSGASFSSSGGRVTLEFNDDGFIEEGDYRYTCRNAGGCTVEDRVVTKGTIVESSIGAGGSPDLVAESVSVSDASPDAGASFTLDATVRNAGDGDAAATTLRYYRSDDAAVSASDTEVGTDSVGALAAGATSAESIPLNAPSDAGTYYYGACVDTVSGESDTSNNCTDSVAVEVSDGGTSADDHGDTVDTATTVSADSSTAGELEDGGDLDYFRLDIGETVALTVWTSGDTDTHGTLFDADGASIETDDDDGSGTNFEIERELDAGTYFLEVRGFSASTTGSYRLNASTMYGGLALELRSCTDIPVAISLGHDTEQTALDTAADACEDDGGSASACSSNTLAFRRCGAIVYGESEAGTRCHVNGYSIFASTRTAAEDVALEACRSEGRTGCRILADDGGERMSGCNSSSPLAGLTREEFEGSTPTGWTTTTLSDSGNVWGIPEKFTNDSSTGTVAYMLLGTHKGCAFANAEADGSSRVHIRTEQLGTLSDFESATVCRKTSRIWDSFSAMRMTRMRFFDETSPTNIREYVYNASTGSYDERTPAFESPDLVVETPSVDDANPDPGATIELNVTVRNAGDGDAAATTLRYYRSPDATISSSDTEVGTEAVAGLAAGENSAESISLTAPSASGTYYFGACVDSVAGESDTGNNCSTGVQVDVGGSGGAPDLVVESPSVDDDTVDTGDTIMFSATVRNSGDAESGSTTLRYYRSSNSTISSSDTEVGTDAVAGLAAGANSAESISLTVPSDAGTYYYGACVDSVSGESDTANNCSDGVEVEVSDGGGGTVAYCRDDDVVEPGDRCDIYNTTRYFEVEASGRGCLRGGFTICAGNSISWRTSSFTLVASRNDDDSWTIEDVEPEPDD